MKPHRLALLPLLALAAATAEAQTTVMDFSTLLPTGYETAPGFGSHTNLDASNRTRTDFGNSPEECAHVFLWGEGFSSLPAAAFPCAQGKVGELQFQPLNGLSVTLNSMSFGSWESHNGVGPLRNLTVKVYNDAWSEVYSFIGTVSTTLTLFPDVSSATGLYLQWGTDWDDGINYISTTVGNQLVTPEPESVLLLTVGLGFIGVVRRRLNGANARV